ncbi:unnamed protein product [Acanthocheilonema viteae]|uniref:Biopterin-dependent aromatic amino acid hydroxylase family profile domain-containing protein n=1 Tax=Acanthocheilonema viteae TaxID=6277 RepID=A0A498SYT9_ACAVI|nr:unnamed protein product [Acanthocheilonema viteae]
MSKFGRRDSLVHQASVDRLQNAAIKQQNVEKHRREIAESLEYARILKLLNDEGIELIWSSGANVSMRIAVILAAEALLHYLLYSSTEDSTQFLSTILMEYKINGVRLKHLEIRPEQKQNESFVVCDMKKNLKVKFEIFTDCECTKDAFLNVTKCLADRYHILRLNIYGSTDGSFEKAFCSFVLTFSQKQQGHGDNAYIQRREQLNVIAKAYKYGDKLPDIEYSPEEHKTWEVVFNKLKSLHSSHTCMEYQQNFKQMELEGLLEPTRIPKLSLVNKYLQRKICKVSQNSHQCIAQCHRIINCV